jgi:N utilization substance protein A
VYTEASGARSCIVVVPDNQLSLAIGKEGQNARLAAKLTGWKIDIKSQSQYLEQMGDAVVVEEAPALDQFGDFGGEAFTGIDLPVDEDDTL